MGNPGNQRDYEPVRHRLEVFLQSPYVRRVRQAKGLGTEATGNGQRQRRGKNAGRIRAGHGANGASVLKKSGQKRPRCRLRCYPVADPVAGENPVTAGFSPL